MQKSLSLTSIALFLIVKKENCLNSRGARIQKQSNFALRAKKNDNSGGLSAFKKSFAFFKGRAFFSKPNSGQASNRAWPSRSSVEPNNLTALNPKPSSLEALKVSKQGLGLHIVKKRQAHPPLGFQVSLASQAYQETWQYLQSLTKKPIYTAYSKNDEVKLVTIGIASANRIRQWAEKTLPSGKVVGEVTNANTLHHKTFKPQKGGLFCERIFGPLKDFECACGGGRKVKTLKNKIGLMSQASTKQKTNKSQEHLSQTVEALLMGSVQAQSVDPTQNGKDSSKSLSMTTNKLGLIDNYKRFFCAKCDVEYTWSVIRRYQLGYIKLNAPVTHVWYVKGNPSYVSLLLDMPRKDLISATYCGGTLTIENSLKGEQFYTLSDSPDEIFAAWEKVVAKSKDLSLIGLSKPSSLEAQKASKLGLKKVSTLTKNKLGLQFLPSNASLASKRGLQKQAGHDDKAYPLRDKGYSIEIGQASSHPTPFGGKDGVAWPNSTSSLQKTKGKNYYYFHKPEMKIKSGQASSRPGCGEAWPTKNFLKAQPLKGLGLQSYNFIVSATRNFTFDMNKAYTSNLVEISPCMALRHSTDHSQGQSLAPILFWERQEVGQASKEAWHLLRFHYKTFFIGKRKDALASKSGLQINNKSFLNIKSKSAYGREQKTQKVSARLPLKRMGVGDWPYSPLKPEILLKTLNKVRKKVGQAPKEAWPTSFFYNAKPFGLGRPYKGQRNMSFSKRLDTLKKKELVKPTLSKQSASLTSADLDSKSGKKSVGQVSCQGLTFPNKQNWPFVISAFLKKWMQACYKESFFSSEIEVSIRLNKILNASLASKRNLQQTNTYKEINGGAYNKLKKEYLLQYLVNILNKRSFFSKKLEKNKELIAKYLKNVKNLILSTTIKQVLDKFVTKKLVTLGHRLVCKNQKKTSLYDYPPLREAGTFQQENVNTNSLGLVDIQGLHVSTLGTMYSAFLLRFIFIVIAIKSSAYDRKMQKSLGRINSQAIPHLPSKGVGRDEAWPTNMVGLLSNYFRTYPQISSLIDTWKEFSFLPIFPEDSSKYFLSKIQSLYSWLWVRKTQSQDLINKLTFSYGQNSLQAALVSKIGQRRQSQAPPSSYGQPVDLTLSKAILINRLCIFVKKACKAPWFFSKVGITKPFFVTKKKLGLLFVRGKENASLASKRGLQKAKPKGLGQLPADICFYPKKSSSTNSILAYATMSMLSSLRKLSLGKQQAYSKKPKSGKNLPTSFLPDFATKGVLVQTVRVVSRRSLDLLFFIDINMLGQEAIFFLYCQAKKPNSLETAKARMWGSFLAIHKLSFFSFNLVEPQAPQKAWPVIYFLLINTASNITCYVNANALEVNATKPNWFTCGAYGISHVKKKNLRVFPSLGRQENQAPKEVKKRNSLFLRPTVIKQKNQFCYTYGLYNRLIGSTGWPVKVFYVGQASLQKKTKKPLTKLVLLTAAIMDKANGQNKTSCNFHGLNKSKLISATVKSAGLSQAPQPIPFEGRREGAWPTASKLVNNIYCLSHRKFWYQEKDSQFFALYYFATPNIEDKAIPTYSYRNYDFSLLNTLFSKEEKKPSGQPAMAWPTPNKTDYIDSQLDKQNLNVSFSGAGIIQKLLAEFDYFELKKMDKQNRILLYDLNKYVRKLKKSLSVSTINTRKVSLRYPKNKKSEVLEPLPNNKTKRPTGVGTPLVAEMDTSLKKYNTANKKLLVEVLKQKDSLIRRTKLIRKIFRNYIGFSSNRDTLGSAKPGLPGLPIKKDKSFFAASPNGGWADGQNTKPFDNDQQVGQAQGPSTGRFGGSGKTWDLNSMILTLLPVLPPDLRPIVKMGNQIAASDLNRLYQRVIYRNDRLKKFLKDSATNGSYEMKYAQRLLQEAVDNLIQNGKSGVVAEKDARGRALKSLSDLLKGKQGRFRQYLLGKRVDYSGRSVIVVGPRLKLHECGIPKEMALELYLPFLIKRILNQKLARTVIGAKALIQNNKPLTWSLLREIMKTCPVLLNRAPTLHRLGFQAFQPKLVEGRAILLHPLTCSAFNADFDGDQMAVHIPISVEARTEAWKLMLSRNNLLSPATGEPLALPSQDMVLGCYYLTTNSNTRSQQFEKGFGFYFDSLNDVLRAYNQGNLSVHAIIWVKWNGLVENTNDLEKPLEIRIDQYGYSQMIYAKTQFLYVPQEATASKQGIGQQTATLKLVNKIIRTTPGKILFNYIIQQSLSSF